MAIAELHKKANEERSDLDNRTKAEIVAVIALKDSAIIASESGEESRHQTSVVMNDGMKCVDEWKKADAEHMVTIVLILISPHGYDRIVVLLYLLFHAIMLSFPKQKHKK